MGRVRQCDPGRSRRRDHDDRRYAAQQYSADCRCRRSRRQTTGGGRQIGGERRVLGWCSSREPRAITSAARRRSLRFQVLSAAFGCGRIPAAVSARTREGVDRDSVVRRVDDRACRGRSSHLLRPTGVGYLVLGIPRLTPSGCRESGDRPGDRPVEAYRLPGAHPSSVERGCTPHDCPSSTRRGSRDCGDVPALPVFRRRGHFSGRNAVQVLPAHPRGRQSRAVVAGPCRRRHRHSRHRPLPVDRRSQAPRHRRLR